jgi:hypothetical protein
MARLPLTSDSYRQSLLFALPIGADYGELKFLLAAFSLCCPQA